MKGIRVDPTRRRVTVQAGATWKDLDAETQQFGLAVTGGLVSSTGVAGFTTGGGIGWLMRKHGLAADNMVGADVVTADGQFVHASADENPELFWGLRGGGGNFGVVTSFEFQLHEVGAGHFRDRLLPRRGSGAGVARLPCRHREAPDELTTMVNLLIAPPVPFLPESAHGKPIVAVIGCWRVISRPARRDRTLPFAGHRHRRRVCGQPVCGVAAGARPAVAAGRAQLFPLGIRPRRRRRNTSVLLDSFATLAQPDDGDSPATPRRRGGSGARRRNGLCHARARVHRQRRRPDANRRRVSPMASNGPAG